MSQFGQRLRELRESAGWTQVQLAERAGLHPQGIVKLERGEREPSFATALALADALGVTCIDLRQPPTVAPEPRGPGRPPKPASPATEASAAPAAPAGAEKKKQRTRPKKH